MAPPRLLPPLDDRNRAFWTGGHRGELLIEWCPACERWQHPPAGTCESCGGTVEHRPVSGRATLFTFTVNHHRFHPEVPTPYTIALVELVEQPDLRIVTNVVDCDEADLRIGMPLEVRFEDHGEHAVPVFAPEGAGS